MTTICSCCGKQLEEKEGEKYQCCKDCQRFTATGSKQFLKSVKGGKNERKIN